MWTSPRAPRPWRRRLFTTVALLALLVPAVAALAAYPVVDVNTGLPIDEGTAKNITSSMLHVSMQNTPAGSIQYHLTSAPAHGALLLNGTQLIAGQIFTQTQLIAGQIFTQDDIDNGRLAYSHDGSDTPTDIDSFEFRAADGLGQPMTRVSVDSFGNQGNGGSFRPALSADGAVVAFDSDATNLVMGDTNGASDVFMYEAGQTTLVSVGLGGAAGNSDSYDPSISPNGRFVAFYSVATNLVNGDTNTCGPFTTPGSCSDVFVRDLQMGQTTRVSVASDGNQGNSVSYDPSISADGRFVAFYSLASNLVDGVDGDTNNTYDVFVHDRQTGQTTRVSVDSNDTQANGGSFNVSLSADGRAVAFYSNATNLVSGDTNGTDDIFVADRGIAQSFAISVTSVNDQPTLSSFADQTVLSGSSITMPFQVGDEETALDQLGLTASSSNPALVPNVKTNLSIVGDKLKPNRSLVVQPLANQTGQATITNQVSDGSVTTPQSFTFTVQPPPPPPPPPWLAPPSL